MVDFSKQFEEHFTIDKIFQPFEKNYLKIKDKEEPLLKTGISCIDEPLRGLTKNTTMLIGAESGSGKTEVAIMIAENIARQGKKVVIFALESYNGEIEDRRKFSKMYKEATKILGTPFYFKDWVCGKYKALIDYEKTIKPDKDLEGNLFIRYRNDSEDYTIEKFESEIQKLKSHKDIGLIVIDHLHYFYLNPDNSENTEMKMLMNKLRDMTMLNHIPIILIAHLRKKDRGEKTLVPDYYEFHGSSDIFKIATDIITMAPDFEVETKDNKYATFFRICKDRFGNMLRKYIFGCMYDAEFRRYSDTYKLYLLKKHGTDKEFLNLKRHPSWAIHALSEDNSKTIVDVVNGVFK